jgi:hypothetical protein
LPGDQGPRAQALLPSPSLATSVVACGARWRHAAQQAAFRWRPASVAGLPLDGFRARRCSCLPLRRSCRSGLLKVFGLRRPSSHGLPLLLGFCGAVLEFSGL